MARQYKRAYTLTITPEDGPIEIISELRIVFEVTKTLLSFPNLCRIDLYNPNPETLSKLQRRYTPITLNAGYEERQGLIYKGQIRNVYQTKQRRDRIVTIFSSDGERDWQNSVFNKTFTSNVTIKNTIEEVIKSFETLSTGSLEGLPEIADKLRGQVLSGPSRFILDQYANEYNFTWSIQDGEVVTTPISTPLTGTPLILINSATGMLGDPIVTEIGADVITLLNPELLPNRAIKIESIFNDIKLGNLFFRNIKRTSAEGTYKIQEVIFKGDSRGNGNDWISTVKGRITNV